MSDIAPAIGIDLGTTYSSVGIWYEGRVKIVEVNGKKTHASVVAFMNQGNNLIGNDAQNTFRVKPQNKIYAAKRMIGLTYAKVKEVEDFANYNYKIRQSDKTEKPVFIVQPAGKPEQEWTPDEISSQVLTYLKGRAENQIGKSIQDCVITVPAYFTEKQKQATKDAASGASLNVLQIIPEPSAAVMTYFYDRNIQDKKDHEEKILVFDLGGGTFDVTIAEVKQKSIKDIAIKGDMHLGGEDFDNCLVKLFIERYYKEHGSDFDISEDHNAMGKLRKEARECKEYLTGQDEQEIAIQSVFNGNDFETCVTKDKFEEICEPLFKKCITKVEEALSEAKLKPEDISQVLMVGGSSRIPKVQDLMAEKFGAAKLNRTLQEMEAIAFGATIAAAKKSDFNAFQPGEEPQQFGEVLIENVSPMSVGIGTGHDFKDFELLIPKNTKCPTPWKTREFDTMSDYQNKVTVKVFQTENDTKLTAECHELGEYTTSIRQDPVSVNGIKIQFRLDENGLLDFRVYERVQPNTLIKQKCFVSMVLDQQQIKQLQVKNEPVERDSLKLRFKTLARDLELDLTNKHSKEVERIIEIIKKLAKEFTKDDKIEERFAEEADVIKQELTTDHTDQEKETLEVLLCYTQEYAKNTGTDNGKFYQIYKALRVQSLKYVFNAPQQSANQVPAVQNMKPPQ